MSETPKTHSRYWIMDLDDGWAVFDDELAGAGKRDHDDEDDDEDEDDDDEDSLVGWYETLEEARAAYPDAEVVTD